MFPENIKSDDSLPKITVIQYRKFAFDMKWVYIKVPPDNEFINKHIHEALHLNSHITSALSKQQLWEVLIF